MMTKPAMQWVLSEMVRVNRVNRVGYFIRPPGFQNLTSGLLSMTKLFMESAPIL